MRVLIRLNLLKVRVLKKVIAFLINRNCIILYYIAIGLEKYKNFNLKYSKKFANYYLDKNILKRVKIKRELFTLYDLLYQNNDESLKEYINFIQIRESIIIRKIDTYKDLLILLELE